MTLMHTGVDNTIMVVKCYTSTLRIDCKLDFSL